MTERKAAAGMMAGILMSSPCRSAAAAENACRATGCCYLPHAATLCQLNPFGRVIVSLPLAGTGLKLIPYFSILAICFPNTSGVETTAPYCIQQCANVVCFSHSPSRLSIGSVVNQYKFFWSSALESAKKVFIMDTIDLCCAQFFISSWQFWNYAQVFLPSAVFWASAQAIVCGSKRAQALRLNFVHGLVICLQTPPELFRMFNHVESLSRIMSSHNLFL